VGILFALFIAIKTIMSVLPMEKNKNRKIFRFFDAIINSFFSIIFVLARVDPMVGEGIGYAPLHIVVD